MSNLIPTTTDDEVWRYSEAANLASIKIDPAIVKDKTLKYNPITGRNDILMPLTNGGYTKIGDEEVVFPVPPTQKDIAEPDQVFDQTTKSWVSNPAVNLAPAPTVMSGDNLPQVNLPNANLGFVEKRSPLRIEMTQPNDARFAEFQSVIGTADAGPTMADYEAAGFTPDEVSTFQTQAFESTMPADAMVPTPLTQAQIDQYVQEADSQYVSVQPGLPEIAVRQAANIVSEVGKGIARGTITEPANFLKDSFGLYDPLAFQLVDPQTGEFDPKILLMSREEKTALDEKMAAGEMPYAINLDDLISADPGTPIAGLAGGIAQFAGAYAGLGKLFRLNNGLVTAAGRGAAADFLAFSGNEGRLTDVLVEMGVPDALISDFLKTDPNDPDYIGRFKNALEGAALGAMVEIIGPLFRAVKNGDMSPQAVSQLLTDGRQKAKRFMVQQIDNAEQRVANNSGTLYSNPIGPITDEILALIGRMIRPSEKTLLETKLPPEIVQRTEVQIAQQKNQFPAEEGWVQNDLEVTGVKQDKKGNVVVSYKEIPYNFHLTPEGQTDAEWKATMTARAVEQVRGVAERAASGDAPAQEIIRQANWYRAMRSRMRQEFGGLGDVFADLLGTTSAQTGVTQNWDNAVEIMRRFTRGEFDKEIKMYEDMIAAGDASPVKLGQYHNDPDNPFVLITKAGGQLFNANSPASTRALLDMFRTAQGAPKTPNFTGNIIGYTNAATIDVWAARFLRRVAGLDRIPPPAEKGVAGAHLVGSTLENPKVGSEFGFGQAVLKDAVDQINANGIITDVDPSIGQMGPDDLQAVLWFIEKEIWTANNWTSKAGEGGSLDLEASFAGAADQGTVKDLRSIASSSFKAPPPLKQKAGESNIDYAARTAEREQKARTKFNAKTAAAAEQLDPMKASLARYILGVSTERPGMRPTNLQQSQVSARLGEPAKEDKSVVMYQINNTYGRFMQSDERAFNAEFVVRENFNPNPIKKRMVEVAKEFDQDAVFISKVLLERTPSALPGVEIYFSNRQNADFARALSDELTTYGVDGFTFVTDSRVMDQPIRQATQNTEAVAGITGIRFQYIPEFDMGAAAWNAMSDAERSTRVDEVQELYYRVAIDIEKKNPDVSTANLTFYDTEVIERDGYDAIIGTAAQ